MITSIEFTDSGVEKFNRFFAASAKEGVSMQAVMFEVLDVLTNRVAESESLTYELGSQYTNTGRPEHLRLDRADIDVIEDADE